MSCEKKNEKYLKMVTKVGKIIYKKTKGEEKVEKWGEGHKNNRFGLSNKEELECYRGLEIAC